MNLQKLRFPAVMGILNVTPDSFYDGGKFEEEQNAVTHAELLVEQGANILDIGGQSTLEVEEVSVEEELRRVIPVIEAIKQSSNQAIVSVDTYKADVARLALDAGTDMINDVTTGRKDAEMLKVIAEAGCLYVMMHCKDAEAPTKIKDIQYENILQTIHAFFEKRIDVALKAGIRKENMILDPGLGHFVSSDPQYSWQILENLEFLQDFHCPVLVSPSRKSFTGPDVPPSERLEETLRATRIALEHGANIIRTHDVAETSAILQYMS